MKKQLLLVAALLLTKSLAARAELVFERNTLDLQPSWKDENAIANFKYENKGDKPVHINAVRTSCGCTTAALKKNDVAPGEKGEITATFKIGDRTGLQQKTITVETDDPKQPSTVLTLKANITPALTLQPSFVYWQSDEPAKPKTIIATTTKEAAIKKLEVTSSSPDFTAQIEPGPSEGEFRINVQPNATSKMTSTTLMIKPVTSGTNARTFYARAQVTMAPPVPSPTH